MDGGWDVMVNHRRVEIHCTPPDHGRGGKCSRPPLIVGRVSDESVMRVSAVDGSSADPYHGSTPAFVQK